MKIVVGGYGCVCAAGKDATALAGALFDGRQVHPTLPIGRLDSVYTAEYPVFQVEDVLLAQQGIDESLSLSFIRKAADEALAQSGLTTTDLRGLRVGVCLGSSVDASFNSFEFYRDVRASRQGDIQSFKRFLTESISDQLLAYYGVTGISQTVVTACASGTDAIGIGAEWIENDFCDVVIAGGTDALNMVPYTGFIRLMVAGKEPCMPFAKGRKGVTLGEGAAALVLVSSSLAQRRGIAANGFILGYGNACDGYHATAPEPTGRGLKKAIGYALAQADVAVSDLAFVNAHGTGTADNDAAESVVFNNVLAGVPVCATKSYTGHTLAASGAVEAVISLISLNHGKIPKVNFFDQPDEALGLIPVLATQEIANNKQVALSNSLAFGGCNSAVVLGGKEFANER